MNKGGFCVCVDDLDVDGLDVVKELGVTVLAVAESGCNGLYKSLPSVWTYEQV